ncbi:MAG TPA: tetratricopeptide repeat protein [Candidatus Eisenbacteria bacterium]|jgi:tetratricopeptide (TPR) repeat protein
MTHPRKNRTLAPWLALVGACWLTVAPAARADEIKDARTALQAGRLDDAQRLFEKAASQGSAEGRAGVGEVWLRRRQNSKAQEAFETAQKMDPQLALPYYGQAEVQRREGHCEAAIPLYQKATDLDRKFPDAQLALGECLAEAKRTADAVAALSQGLKWGPKWRPRFLVALGNAELRRDSLRSANVYYTQAREEAPSDPLPRRALGDFYLNKRGIAELAIPEYQAAVALDSSDVELRFALAQGLFRGQRYNDALQEYRWVAEHDPDFAPGLLGLGNLYYLSGAADPRRYQDARAPLEKYTQLVPDDGKGWSLLGRTYFYLRMKDEAAQALDKAEQLGGGNKEMYTVMGRLYVDRKDWKKALEFFAKGDPTTRDQLTIAQVSVFEGNPARAESTYRAVVGRDSTSSDARFALVELGKLLFRAQKYPEAVEALQRRIGLDPNSDEAYYYIGLSYKEMKRYPEALEALRQAVTLADGKADRQFWLGVLYAQLDSVPPARSALRRSVELDSSSAFAGVAYRQLGFYELLDRNYGEAIHLLERAVQLNDKDVQAWVWMGQGFQNSGNRNRAMECYKRALALDANQPDALKGVKSLGAAAPREGGAQ